MGLRIQSVLPAEIDQLIQRVIGAAIEVHKHLGPGFLESIYLKAFCYELDLQKIKYLCQKEILVTYKDLKIAGQRLDLLIENCLIVELKAVDQISPVHEAQLISYLKSTGLKAGLIINFRVKQLRFGIRRIVN